MHYFPLALPFLLAFAFVILIVLGLIEVGILRYAYSKIGVSHRYMFVLLLGSLLGSYVNIPVATLPAQQISSDQVFSYFGMQHIIPNIGRPPRTILAVNLGGAVIPTILSLYLVIRNRLYLQALIGTAVVAIAVYMTARPVPGVGIVEPFFIPLIVATVIALLISRRCAPSEAYIAGSLGTLIGADLLNLGAIAGLGAPVASIGGAGTFDGIFVAGILSVILAGALGRKGEVCA